MGGRGAVGEGGWGYLGRLVAAACVDARAVARPRAAEHGRGVRDGSLGDGGAAHLDLPAPHLIVPRPRHDEVGLRAPGYRGDAICRSVRNLDVIVRVGVAHGRGYGAEHGRTGAEHQTPNRAPQKQASARGRRPKREGGRERERERGGGARIKTERWICRTSDLECLFRLESPCFARAKLLGEIHFYQSTSFGDG